MAITSGINFVFKKQVMVAEAAVMLLAVLPLPVLLFQM